jgi:hypothetical protein
LRRTTQESARRLARFLHATVRLLFKRNAQICVDH